jgi:hypothetical protein
MFSLPHMGQQRVTVRYVMQANGNVKGQLLLDGSILAASPDLANGSDIQYKMENFDPGHPGNGPADSSGESQYQAGDWVAFLFNAHQYSDQSILRLERRINQAALDINTGRPVDFDDQIGAALALAGMRYYQEYNQHADTISSLHHAYVSYDEVEWGFISDGAQFQVAHDDRPVPFLPTGFDSGFNLPDGTGTAYDLEGNGQTQQDLYRGDTDRILSMDASNLESSILEEVFGTPSISTTKGIELAHAAGQDGNGNDINPVYVINENNAPTLIPLLHHGSYVIDEVRRLVILETRETGTIANGYRDS